MPRTKIILNPNAGRGYGRSVRPEIERNLTQLGVSFELVETTHVGHGISLASEAVRDGFEIIVAVGGDGTTNEVVNGLMLASPERPAGTLACIPAGSGNDFAVMNGMATNLDIACRAIAAGNTQVIDVGRVSLDGQPPRYFDNAVGTGFDALVVMETRKMNRLRGMAMYIPAVLKTIFLTMRTPTVQVTIDGNTEQVRPLMVVALNGPREGSTFHLTPDALYDDGLLDVLVADEVSKLEMLTLLPRFMNGTHLSHRAVRTLRAQRITLRSEDPLFVHVDGEILNEHSHEVEVEILPHALRMISSF
ncbi:MAG: diacylglycerol/lipid kinase family protein [Anaerolineae bacterium]|jgi:diacylglycerol kinase (ATP)|nr:diacylglycerol kinase family lipid kinase [Chloroflexota bacterium]